MQLDGYVYDPLVPTPVFHERGVIDCEPAAPLFWRKFKMNVSDS